jgi:hypothetical protein
MNLVAATCLTPRSMWAPVVEARRVSDRGRSIGVTECAPRAQPRGMRDDVGRPRVWPCEDKVKFGASRQKSRTGPLVHVPRCSLNLTSRDIPHVAQAYNSLRNRILNFLSYGPRCLPRAIDYSSGQWRIQGGTDKGAG